MTRSPARAKAAKPKAVRPHPMVSQIVGRCHVGDSYLQVIRYAVSRFRDGRRAFLGMSRPDRRRFLEEVVAAHRENRDLYSHVMRGQPWPKSK